MKYPKCTETSCQTKSDRLITYIKVLPLERRSVLINENGDKVMQPNFYLSQRSNFVYAMIRFIKCLISFVLNNKERNLVLIRN